ncbi:hypothetical protein Pla22_30690 [Rubripirellula amarantea]|uniref:3-keto-disaccharide hydrolase domain-containing protein n=1 Tax=Rubripirellula amarantea TaxID=2527999 RepID=A0A5C5WID0_9BACT|nr:hypothetical protein [Rubripirellula amarantea]TWT50327.1 hypothetical protein Pla22_30690 [Rubripirellula amarantea]
MNPSRRFGLLRITFYPFIAVILATSVSFADPPNQASSPAATATLAEENAAESSVQPKGGKWTPLVNHWESIQFGGEGSVDITKNNDQALIRLELGDPITGVRFSGEVPQNNYELKFQAKRIEGIDFFCGVTFPIDESALTLVLGGWGGGITGISSIDGLDASENSTTLFRHYENEIWYDVRIRVSDFGVEAWIGEPDPKNPKQREESNVVELMREGQKFGLRFEMDLCTPLGLANYQCVSEFRNLGWRKLSQSEIDAAKAKHQEWTEDQ